VVKPHAVLHHNSLGIADLAIAGTFYDAVLGALGYRRVFEHETAIGYGVQDGEDKLCLKLQSLPRSPGPGFHLAFAAPSREAVAKFHVAGIAAGGMDNGAPGLRPAYGPNYFAAFVIDPDGHHIEAVLNAPA
jgi:catechol 2,3-dioxygenase-like lactoylglutathione lyase family enzyme